MHQNGKFPGKQPLPEAIYSGMCLGGICFVLQITQSILPYPQGSNLGWKVSLHT